MTKYQMRKTNQHKTKTNEKKILNYFCFLFCFYSPRPEIKGRLFLFSERFKVRTIFVKKKFTKTRGYDCNYIYLY